MAKTTISFTIEEEQLRAVDALTERLDRDRSSTLRLLIEAGMLTMEEQRPARGLTDREPLATHAARGAVEKRPLPEGAFPEADADRAA